LLLCLATHLQHCLKTALTDTGRLGKIQADLDRSPFQGKGHCTLWASLRVIYAVRVSRKRILRLMRENRLLRPYRGPEVTGQKHTGNRCRQGTTQALNVMRGTDGTTIPTVEDGYVWLFSALEH